MNGFIREVNALRQIPRSELGSQIKRVAVMLSSSRSGSSLIKHVLAAHPDIASMDGEISPYLALTKNGYGFNSDSDAIGKLVNKSELIDNLFDDLTLPSQELPPLLQLKGRWVNRMIMQFPSLFIQEKELRLLMESLDEALLSAQNCQTEKEEKDLQKIILSKVFSKTPWRINYYDDQQYQIGADSNLHFDELIKIEEPPFVLPKLYRRQFCNADVENKVLLFKTPSDVYRIGMYEQLFPNAEIKYIHLSRGYAQSVNGLMDGWLSPLGFFSHDLQHSGTALEIRAYSDCVSFGKHWWKFDLPPNWREFRTARLEEVCLNQWISAHRSILASGLPTLRLSFEEFISAPALEVKKVTDYLGLQEMQTLPALPITMATDTPQSGRWKKREQQLLALGERPQVGRMMEALGYPMQAKTWL